MASCDNTVLTGQEGLIQFKPLGTTNCVDDYCPFVGRPHLSALLLDYDVDDCIEFEPSRFHLAKVKPILVVMYLPMATPSTSSRRQRCGRRRRRLRQRHGGRALHRSVCHPRRHPITWDNSDAGEEIVRRRADSIVCRRSRSTGYNGGSTLVTLTPWGTINHGSTVSGGSERCATENSGAVAGGAVTSVTVITRATVAAATTRK